MWRTGRVGSIADGMPRLINVSNRLPVTVAATANGGHEIRRSSGGLVAALEGVGGGRYGLTWIGWPGGAVDEADRPGHLGLRAMRDRAQVAGADLQVLRREEGGTRVRLSFPSGGSARP